MNKVDDWDDTSYTIDYPCKDIENEVECETAIDEVTGDKYCYWDYSGQGIEYQILAGPIFVVIMSVSGVIIGFFGDKVSRLAMKLSTVELILYCHIPRLNKGSFFLYFKKEMNPSWAQL